MKKWFSVCLILVTIVCVSQSYGGFISSNGFSQLVGLVCVEKTAAGQEIQWQIKFVNDRSGFVARKVTFPSGRTPQVQELSDIMDCENSKYSDETILENRCYSQGFSADKAPTVFQSIPFRDQLHFVIQSPLITAGEPKGSLWKAFPLANCSVVLNEQIKP